MLCLCPAHQALDGQQGAKIHSAPGAGGRAHAKMASKTDSTTWGWGGGAGSVVTPQSQRYHPEERTELWLNSGYRRPGTVQPGWGGVHLLPLVLGKQGEKNHGKSAAGLCKRTHCPPVWMAPGADRQGFMPSCHSQPRAILSDCEAARCRRGRQQNAQTKITWGFICKANSAGGSGFLQAVKKGCIERPGWTEHGGRSSPSPSAALQQTRLGSGSRRCQTTGGKGDLRWEQGRDQLTELGQARFWMGLSRDCQLWGQSFPSPITVLLRFSGISLRVVLAMGHFFIDSISSMPSIVTKHLLSQLWLGLASGSKSHEGQGPGQLHRCHFLRL